MRAILFSAAFVFFCSAAATARGDGMLYQLPEDGAWVVFDMTGVNKNGDREEKFSGTLRMASVGRTTENGVPCRWIEVTLDVKKSNGDSYEASVSKVLMPDKFLKKGENPLGHAVRAWVRTNDKKPEKMGIRGPAQRPERQSLVGNYRRTVEECQATQRHRRRKQTREVVVRGPKRYNARRQEDRCVDREPSAHKTPFGVVSSRWVKTNQYGHNATFELKLADFGTKAQSELPDQQ